ncbi:hypothetical protein ACI2JA_07780 [Alkalihalobacillus sp. NPDC078783]
MKRRKSWLLGVIGFILFFNLSSTPGQAVTFKDLPQVKESDHWIVSLNVATNDSRIQKPNPKAFDTYELEVENKKGDMGAVMVRAYRDEPDTDVRYGLAIMDERQTKGLLTLGGAASYSAMSVTKKAKQIEIDVLWTTGVEGDRPYKETFIFKQ